MLYFFPFSKPYHKKENQTEIYLFRLIFLTFQYLNCGFIFVLHDLENRNAKAKKYTLDTYKV